MQATLATGRPNACNLCHLDKTLGWTAQYLEQWYGVTRPALDTDETFSYTFDNPNVDNTCGCGESVQF